MQKVLDLKVITKASMPLLALFGISLGIAPDSVGSNVVEVGMMVAGMIGVAAVMRKDVSDLKKWRISHDETHQRIAEANEKLAKILGHLEEAKTESERRMREIEHLVYRRRVGDAD